MRALMELKSIFYLMLLQITPNLKGYRYFKEAIIKVCEDGSKKHNMSKVLFKELAEMTGDNVSVVDRTLRHALKKGYERNGIKILRRELDLEIDDDKPSVKEIICLLAEKLALDITNY